MGEVQGPEVQFCARLGTDMAAIAINLRGPPKELLIERRLIRVCGRGRSLRRDRPGGPKNRARQHDTQCGQRSGLNHVSLPRAGARTCKRIQ